MFQKIMLIGNLGRAPEMRYTPTGNPVTNLSVATNRQYTNKSGEQIKETTWVKVSVWGKTAEACNKYLKQGSKVYIEGRLDSDENGNPKTWVAADGSARASWDVVASEVKFLDSKSDTPPAPRSVPSRDYGSAGLPPDDENPF